MNNFLCKHLLAICCIITLTTHTIFADIHKAIGDFSKRPSDICSKLRTPFQKIGQSLEPCIPDAHADIVLPVASCALYLISKQILPEISKTKKVDDNKIVRTAVAALSAGLGVANFHSTWTRDTDTVDWTLKNGLNSFLIASNAYTIYKLSCCPAPSK